MKITAVACLLLMLAACISAPVQEMSDARQAVRAAVAAGAEERAADELAEAQASIDAAQRHLQLNEYREARRSALEARRQAVRALKLAQAGADAD